MSSNKIDFSKHLYALAPLAGFTDLPFRSVVKKFGVDLTVSEMISANSLVANEKKVSRMLAKSPIEEPFSVQIAGSNLDTVKRAVEIINRYEGIESIDLNCGCPAPKVVGNLQGSALLSDLDQMGRVIETIKRYSHKPYTSVKMRLGFNEKDHVRIAKVAESAGADFIAVHGRTRKGRYKEAVDYDAIGEVKAAVSIPVIANGDITSVQKARWVLEYTKADGVMIGRAAVKAPWIFAQIKKGLEYPTSELICSVVLEHFEKMIEHYGEYGAVIFRKNLHAYSKAGYKGASEFRDRINRITDVGQMREEIGAFFSKPLTHTQEVA